MTDDGRSGAAGADSGAAGELRVLVVNAGSSSLKLRLLDGADRLAGSVDLPAPRGIAEAEAVRRALRGARPGGRRRPPHRARRQPVPRSGAHHRPSRAPARGAHRSGAAAPAQVAGRPRRGERRAAGRARRGLLRHRVSCRHPARGRHLRAAARVAQALGPATLRLSRPLPQLCGASRDTAGGPTRRQACVSSAVISAPAPRWPPSKTGARSIPRWASRRSRDW